MRRRAGVEGKTGRRHLRLVEGADAMNDDLLALFRQTGALLDGHFILRSGLHSRQFFQCALLLQHTEIAAQVCGQLADKLRDLDCDTVISPALGGIIVGQEIGRSLGKRHIFAEKEAGGLVLRRGFKISPNETLHRRRGCRDPRRTRPGNDRYRPRSTAASLPASGVIVDRSGGATARTSAAPSSA